MKTFLIKINRKSILKNPKAGRDSEIIFFSSEATVTIEGDARDFELIAKEQNTMLHRTKFSALTVRPFIITEYFVSGSSRDIDTVMEIACKKYKGKISFSIRNNYQEIHSMTENPSHTYKYIKTKVKCQHCKAKFTHDKLQDFDDYDYEGNFVGKANVCPECGKEDACYLEFEKLGAVLLELTKTPHLIVK